MVTDYKEFYKRKSCSSFSNRWAWSAMVWIILHLIT